jgi:hypothetical protein
MGCKGGPRVVDVPLATCVARAPLRHNRIALAGSEMPTIKVWLSRIHVEVKRCVELTADKVNLLRSLLWTAAYLALDHMALLKKLAK